MARAVIDVQIYCDESGGTDRANSIFLVAAVAIDAHTAQVLMKRFGKIIKLKGEIKGHTLSLAQRQVFFRMLHEQSDAVSTTIVCSRADAVGQWAAGAFEEADIYGGLVEEACSRMELPTKGRLNITPDGGRYPKLRAEVVRRALVQQIGAAAPECTLTIAYADSATDSGVQIADIVANSIYQSLGEAAIAPQVRGLVQPMIKSGRLTVNPIELPRLRPHWLKPR